MSGARVDVWLWSVRAAKTRSQANDACRRGRVDVNGSTAKPARTVDVGDVVTFARRDRTLVYVVREPLTSRVGAARAADAFEDRSPPPPPSSPAAGPTPRRDTGTGRPTKRDRRELDRLRGRPNR